MNTKHAKSSCCHAKIYSWGWRRKRCSRCQRTWRFRPRRRGRRQKRTAWTWLHRVLVRSQHIQDQGIRSLNRSPQALTYRFRKALQKLVSRPPVPPAGSVPLVLLTDGIWFRFHKQRWIMYLVAFKPCNENRAYFWDPILLPGCECSRGWRQVFHTFPPSVEQRICAWVVDNVTGIRSLAKEKQWILQLCHFHLISQLRNRRGNWKTLPGTSTREAIYQLIRAVLVASPGTSLKRTLKHIQFLSQDRSIPIRLRMIAREFVRRVHHYRAYLEYPQWHLPATTNTVESMGSIIRHTLQHARNLRTPKSLQLWITGLIRLKKSIVCNGKISTD